VTVDTDFHGNIFIELWLFVCGGYASRV